MRVFRAIALAAILVCSSSQFAQAAPISLAPGNSWQTWEEFLPVNSFFSVEFQLTADAKVQITDFYVVTDLYEVFVNGNSIGNSALKPDWNELGATDPFEAPPFQPDPQLAFESGVFSTFIFNGLVGDLITLKILRVPLISAGGEVFPDSGFAIRALENGEPVGEVPEPATVGLLSAGLVGMLLLRRRS